MNAAPRTEIAVRVVAAPGRLRLKSVTDGKFVQCPRDWRETFAVGVKHTIAARMRSDGKCWVAAPGP